MVAANPTGGPHMKRYLSALVLLAMTSTTSLAGNSFLGLQLTAGTADLATEALSSFPGYATGYPQSEWGFKGEFWNMMSEDYAFNLSAGIGLFNEEDKAGSNAPSGAPPIKYSQTSWHFRVGGDRVVALGNRSYVFFGPGIEYWSGKAKFEGFIPANPTYETESTSRISLSGRIGAHTMIGESWGLTLQAGHKLGYASYEEAGAKSTWWPSSMDASGGLLFRFGGD